MPTRYYTRRSQVPGARVAFAAGKGYYAPGPRRGVAKLAPAPPTTEEVLRLLRAGLQTPAQQLGRARTIAAQEIAAAVAPLRVSARAAQQQAAAQAHSAEQFGLALGRLGGADAEAIRQAYAAAAGQTGALAAGLTGEARAAQQQAAAAESAALEQLGQKPVAVPNEAGANVTAYLGGTLPGSSLAGAGAAQYASALAARRAQAARMGDVANELRGRSIATQRQLAEQVAQLQAQRPKLTREALESLAGERRQDVATLLTALQLQGNQWSDAAQVQQDAAELAAKRAADQQQSAAAKARARTSAFASQGLAPDGRTPLPGFYRDRAGVVRKIPTGMMINAAGQLVAIPEDARGGGRSGRSLSVSELRLTRNDLFKQGRERLGLSPGGRLPEHHWSLKHVRDFLLRRGGSDLINIYGERPAIISMINTVASALHREYEAARAARRAGTTRATPPVSTAGGFGSLYGG